jgi:acyl carrier protein
MLWLPEVRRIMCSVMTASPDDIRAETVPNDIAAWDSLTHLMLVLAIEDEFGISLSSAEIERMTRVADICSIIAGKSGA